MTFLEHEGFQKPCPQRGLGTKGADTTIFENRALRWRHEGAAIRVACLPPCFDIRWLTYIVLLLRRLRLRRSEYALWACFETRGLKLLRRICYGAHSYKEGLPARRTPRRQNTRNSTFDCDGRSTKDLLGALPRYRRTCSEAHRVNAQDSSQSNRFTRYVRNRKHSRIRSTFSLDASEWESKISC